MSILETIKEKLYHKDYAKLEKRRKFWNISYDVDDEYVDGVDGKGNPIITKVRCEDNEDYKYRKLCTVPRNHCKIILDRYNGVVFRNSPRRSEENTDYLDFIANADISGNPINKVMSLALKDAQINGSAILVADHTGSSGTRTLAQARAENERPFIRVVNPSALLNWSVNDGILTEVLIKLVSENGVPFVKYYNDEMFIDFSIKDNKVYEQIDSGSHGYPRIPVVMLVESDFAQIQPIAELQKDLANKLSLKNVELCQKVYTQDVFVGELPELDENGNVDVTIGGSSRIIYLGPDGKLERIGADVAAAERLSEEIADIERAIYRVSGLVSSNPFDVGSPQSGVSKAYDDAQSSDIARSLAAATQNAENNIVSLIMLANHGFEPAKAVYDKEFSINSKSVAINEVKELLRLPIPDVLKTNTIKSLKNGYFSLSEEEEDLFNEQIEASSNI